MLYQYYTKALGTPVGQKVRLFYTSTSKQVLDIHEEARRIAAEQKSSATPAAAPAPAAAPIPSAASKESAKAEDEGFQTVEKKAPSQGVWRPTRGRGRGGL